jgi:hypothetical protein
VNTSWSTIYARPRRALRGLAALGVAVVLALAGTAVAPAPVSAAVPGLLFVTASTGFDSSVYKAVRVFCPNGLQTIGGGYELVGAQGSVVLDDFIPSADNLLVGAGEVVGPGEPADGTTARWLVRATVVCANPVPGYTIVSATSQFRTGPARRVSTTCPAGTVPIGEGASLSNGFGQISISDVQIAGNQVGAGATPDEDGYSGSWSITAYAICAAGLPGLRTIYQFTSPQDSRSLRSETAVCPAGTQVIGGGWSVLNDLETTKQLLNLQLTFGGGSPSTATALASVDANGFGGTWGMFAQAVCANP